MSDIMRPMSFGHLMEWILREYRQNGSVFGVSKLVKHGDGKALPILHERIESPYGPAAGPHTQLAQNIVAAYAAGARFFELKTVQIMDGEELSKCVNKPCITAADECYNCEWSTELTVPQAFAEYVKAWWACKLLSRELGLGAPDGFVFNMSVGYDLEGIKSEKIDRYIEGMKDASGTQVWRECADWCAANLDRFEKVDGDFIKSVPARVSDSITESTLHGCPPDEIERIATYLITEKNLNTYIKCNPTLLGYQFARSTLDGLGYDYIAFDDHHFREDLQWADAVPMFRRLQKLCGERGLEFGVKITNTFPVDVKANELPSEEMYMSGKSLYPLSLSVAAKLSRDFDGKLRIAYSGGADAFNIEKIVGTGIWPVTVATTILKPGGYQRLKQMAEGLDAMGVKPFEGIDVNALNRLAEEAILDPHHVKPAKLPVSRKSKERVPLLDCYTAPCEDACPIHQEITTYVRLAGEGKYEEALKVILNKNALPFITGTICAHGCQSHCNRNFYETPVQIRDTKLECAQKAFDTVIGSVAPTGSCGKKAAVVGGGPSGMAAAYYLAKAGADVTIYEKRDKLGGVVSAIIPDFRIDDSVIDKDVSLLRKLGVKILTNTEAPAVAELKKEYDGVVLAVGAYKRGELKLEGGEAVNALAFLEDFNAKRGKVDLGKNVVVIGGGNTAMDTARAAKRCDGVEHVYLVYRRTKRYMPADEHELLLAIDDGVEFKELLAPVKLEGGSLICKVTRLGERDASGRAGVVETDETVSIPADTVIAAVGEKVPTDYYEANGLNVDDRGRVKVSQTLESSVEGVYVVGDGLFGPSLVVKGMGEAMTAAEAIAGVPVTGDMSTPADAEAIYQKKGILAEPGCGKEAERCLGCSTVCENCVDVCPNRANISVKVPGMAKAQVIHVDYMCNECGNCKVFCPYASAPYLDKFTLFANEKDMADSKNDGFAVLNREELECKVRFLGTEHTWKKGQETKVPEGLQRLIEAVCADYSYML